MGKVSHLTVALENDVSEEYAKEVLAKAIKAMRGVQGVIVGKETNEAIFADMRAHADLREKVYNALDPIFFPDRKR